MKKNNYAVEVVILGIIGIVVFLLLNSSKPQSAVKNSVDDWEVTSRNVCEKNLHGHWLLVGKSPSAYGYETIVYQCVVPNETEKK